MSSIINGFFTLLWPPTWQSRISESIGACEYEAEFLGGSLSILTIRTTRTAEELKSFAESCSNHAVEVGHLPMFDAGITGRHLGGFSNGWSDYQFWLSDGLYQLQIVFNGEGDLSKAAGKIQESITKTKRVEQDAAGNPLPDM